LHFFLSGKSRMYRHLHWAVIFLALAFVPHAASQSLSGPESLEYDAANQRYLVSNRSAGNILASTNGTLSVFTEDPTSPAGMEIMQGLVYVADGARIRGYRLSDASLVVNYLISDAGFLNGLASNGAGLLWASDFTNRRIYAIDVTNTSAPSHSTLIANTVFQPNGVVLDAALNRLLMVSWGANARIAEYRFSDQQLNTLLTTTAGNFDGIVFGCDQALYVSSWSPAGVLKRVALPLSAASSVTDVLTGLSNPADISFASSRSEVAIPNAGSNTLSFQPLACATSNIFANGFE
jgi:hypothetical protein